MKSNTLLLLVICCFFVACDKEDVLVEDNPPTEIIDIDGQEFLIEGDIDGVAFVMRHESRSQYNTPANEDGTNAGRPFFGTSFRIEYPGQLPELDIYFGITESGNSQFEDVVQVGRYNDWYDHSVPSQSVGEAVINRLTFEENVVTNTSLPQLNPENYFEITAITPLPLDDTLDDSYMGKLYKVEGHFAIDLEQWDSSGETPRLTVSYFSAIFYDDSM